MCNPWMCDDGAHGDVAAMAMTYEGMGTTTEINCRGGSRASVGAAVPAALPRVFLQRVPL